ncbi:hypothetical protein [Dehalobacter sp. TBBPA1]|uniref:hypothetical protein n=1 Tax=Dehalobacter sp. TBBPA1 TaxID=3235037 RepID=UPI0034A10963
MSVALLSKKRNILEQIPGAVAAYGQMQMSKGYTGPLMRVRRSSDSAEMDVGLVGARKNILFLNKLSNVGNFEFDSNGDGVGDGWAIITLASPTMVNNIQTFTATATSPAGGLYKTITLALGHIYYACAYLKAPTGYNSGAAMYLNSGVITSTSVSSGDNQFQFKSIYSAPAISTSGGFKIYDAKSDSWQPISFKQVHLFDLTEIFGAGNEPTQAQLDPVIKNLIDRIGYIQGNGYANTASYTYSTRATGTTVVPNLLQSYGDFIYDSNSDGLADGWTIENTANTSVVNEEQIITPTSSFAGIKIPNYPITSNHLYLFCGFVDTNSQSFYSGIQKAGGGFPMTGYNPPQVSGYQFFHAYYYANNVTAIDMKLSTNLETGFVPFKVKKVHLFDITAMYGAGNEPSDSSCETIFSNLLASIPEKKGQVIDVFSSTISGGAGVPKNRTYNILTNGNQKFGATGFTSYAGTMSVDFEGLVNTGAGTSAYPGINQVTNVQWVTGKRYYCRYTFKALHACSPVVMKVQPTTGNGMDSIAVQVNPTIGQWYTKSGITTLDANSSGAITFKVYATYADAATANGKSVKFKNLIVVDMGADSSNPLYNKTLSEMDALVGNYINAFGFEQGEIDYASLLTFLGSNSGYVTKWYDQSGKLNHASQATAAYQPRISNVGVLDFAPYFNGSNNRLVPANNGDSLNLVSRLSIFVDFSPHATGYLFCKSLQSSTDIQYAIYYDSANLKVVPYLEGGPKTSTGNNGIFLNSPSKYLLSWDSTNGINYVNGVQKTQFNFSAVLTPQPNIDIGARSMNSDNSSVSNSFNGNIKALVLFNKELTQGQAGLLQGVIGV